MVHEMKKKFHISTCRYIYIHVHVFEYMILSDKLVCPPGAYIGKDERIV